MHWFLGPALAYARLTHSLLQMLWRKHVILHQARYISFSGHVCAFHTCLKQIRRIPKESLWPLANQAPRLYVPLFCFTVQSTGLLLQPCWLYGVYLLMRLIVSGNVHLHTCFYSSNNDTFNMSSTSCALWPWIVEKHFTFLYVRALVQNLSGLEPCLYLWFTMLVLRFLWGILFGLCFLYPFSSVETA